MAKTIKLRKGFDIKLKGEAKKEIVEYKKPSTYSIKPQDFKGITPKLLVNTGSEVKAGTPLFCSKTNEKLVFPSPVSGEVIEIIRGEKRVILEIKILADNNFSYINNDVSLCSNKQEITETLIKSGAWTLIKQRPYNKIADTESNPKAVFISTFDSAPLATDNNFIIKGNEVNFQKGIDILSKLAPKTYLGLNGRVENNVAFSQCKNAEIVYFDGPHPAGNVGVQIHHVCPVNKGDTVFTLTVQDVIIIGKLFINGHLDLTKTVAIAGSNVQEPHYTKIIAGANIEPLTSNINLANTRIISGNVLTGTKISAHGVLGYYDNLITAIPEGNEEEFLGWLFPSYAKPSISKTFLHWMNPNKKFVVNTNLHGEERAFVVTGEYEKVLPMDIYPQYLLKAIMAQDIESMEALGIYEVSEEDFALCEYVCTSKIDVQNIIKEGLAYIEKEG